MRHRADAREDARENARTEGVRAYAARLDPRCNSVLNRLISFLNDLGQWGYALLFVAAALECAAFLGLVVPGESLVLVGGFFATRGVFDLWTLMIVIALGAVLGDSIGYELGRHLGRTWLERYGGRVGIKSAHLDRAETFFATHGGKAVFLGRFVGFARALVPFIAGSSRMRYSRFAAYNVAGAVLWTVAFVLLGYAVGESWRVAERWIGRASAIAGGAVIVALGAVWTWHWLVRHEVGVKSRMANWTAQPRFATLRRSVAPAMEFVQDRFSNTGYLGLQLTIGVIVLTAATWLFGAVVEDVITGDPLAVLDGTVAAWLVARTTPTLNGVLGAVAAFSSPSLITGLTFIGALVAAMWRRWTWLLALVCAVAGSTLLNLLLRYVFRHTLPGSASDPITAASRYNFPDGHVVTATALYFSFAVAAAVAIRAWRWRVAVILGAMLMLVATAFARMMLGVTYLSDTLAGLAEGVAWLALSLTAVSTVARRIELGSVSAADPRAPGPSR